MSQPLFEAMDIGRHSKDGSWLLRGVSLSVSAGERWGISGPTGSGKTLLLRSLALLDAVHEGRIVWNNRPIADADVPRFRRSVVYLHQRPVLIEGTVEANLKLPWTFRHCPAALPTEESILKLLKPLGRDEGFLKRHSGNLSGGEGQIVALLRAIQLDPCVLLLDEPTAALDAAASAAVESLVDRWLNDGGGVGAVVWVTHDAEQLRRVADKALSLRDGRIVG